MCVPHWEWNYYRHVLLSFSQVFSIPVTITCSFPKMKALFQAQISQAPMQQTSEVTLLVVLRTDNYATPGGREFVGKINVRFPLKSKMHPHVVAEAWTIVQGGKNPLLLSASCKRRLERG